MTVVQQPGQVPTTTLDHHHTIRSWLADLERTRKCLRADPTLTPAMSHCVSPPMTPMRERHLSRPLRRSGGACCIPPSALSRFSRAPTRRCLPAYHPPNSPGITTGQGGLLVLGEGQADPSSLATTSWRRAAWLAEVRRLGKTLLRYSSAKG